MSYVTIVVQGLPFGLFKEGFKTSSGTGEFCTLFSVGGPPSPPNKWGTLFNIRQDVPSRAAWNNNRTSTSSSYLSTSWLVPEGPNSMLGPSPQAIAQKRVPRLKEFGPSARFNWDPMVNRVRH